MQLRFASFAVINLREDLHLQECARAGRTTKKRPKGACLLGSLAERAGFEPAVGY